MLARKRYLLGVWVLAITIVLKLVLVLYTYNLWKNLARETGMNIPYKTILLRDIIFLTILFFEMIAYWFLRYRIKNKIWVRIHVWSLFFVLLIIPFLTMFAIQICSRQMSLDDISQAAAKISKFGVYIFWVIVLISHSFFITTIVKSLAVEAENERNDEPPGILDEFVRRS